MAQGEGRQSVARKDRLTQSRYGCLPVVTGGKLAGIITDTDFLAVAINLLQQLEELEPVSDNID